MKKLTKDMLDGIMRKFEADIALTEDEAAQWLGCSVSKLRSDRRFGVGAPYVKDGRSVRYAPSALARYRAGREVNPGGARG